MIAGAFRSGWTRCCRSSARRWSSSLSPTVTLIPGDGVGPELTDAVTRVLTASGAPVTFDVHHLTDLRRLTKAEYDEAIASVKTNKVCLTGTLATPDVAFDTGDKRLNLNLRFRRDLDLFANVVRAQSHVGVRNCRPNVDLVVIREQLEGEYSALEHESVTGVVECLKIVTREKSRRIAKFAFDYATKHDRKKVTAVHKANIMKLGDGLFLSACEEMASLYPGIEFETMIVDNCAMQLVSNPHQFDVMLTPNLYGDIVINLATGLVGGAGVVAGESFSADAVTFEPGTRHMFATAAGKNLANPTASLLAAANMLDHLNLGFFARNVADAVDKVLRSGKNKTKDLGGHATTQDFTNAVIDNLK